MTGSSSPSPALTVRTGSLRRRVVLASLGLLLVVLIGTGLVVNVVLADRLRSDLHNRVADRAGFAQVLVAERLPVQELADQLTGQGILAAYTAPSGSVVVGRDQPRIPGLRGAGQSGQGGPGQKAPAQSGPPSRPPAQAKVAVIQRGEQLIATVPAEQGTLTLTTSLVEVDRTLATLHRVELAAGAGTLLVAGLLLALIIGVAMAPLNRMTKLARRIRDGARGNRLHPTHPNTDLGRTAVAFDEMLDALEAAEADAVAAEARMRQFLADASHDLRTPIAGVISTAELVLRDNPVRARREAQLVALIQQAQRAGRLVDDLLLMARLDGGSPALTPTGFDLAELVEQLGFPRPAHHDPAAATASIWADRDATHRILANLISNARRAGGRVSVEVGRDGPSVVVDVCDDGPGIPAPDRDRIFERFVRLDHSRATPGSGLGLPIARGLARSMGGDVILLDRTERTTFRLILPVAFRPVHVDHREVAAAGAGQWSP